MKEMLKRILVNIKTQLFTEKFATWILVLYFVLISVVFTIHCLEGSKIKDMSEAYNFASSMVSCVSIFLFVVIIAESILAVGSGFMDTMIGKAVAIFVPNMLYAVILSRHIEDLFSYTVEGYSDFWIPLLVSCGVYNVVLLIVKTVYEEVWRVVEEKKCIEQNQS